MYSSYDDVLKVVLADGSAIVRAGIKRLLADVPEIRIVEECADAESAIAAVSVFRPDLVLMDFHLGKGTAVDVLRKTRSMNHRPISIVHTLDAKPNIRAISYAAGADVFYDKGQDITPLLTMLRKLAVTLLESEAAVVA